MTARGRGSGRGRGGAGAGTGEREAAKKQTTESPTISSPARGPEIESRVSLRKAKAPIRYESIDDELVKENVVQKKRKTLNVEKPLQPSNGKSSYSC